MTSSFDEKSKAFHEVVSNVVHSLVSARHESGGSFISMPVLYPSGSMVMVRIELHQEGRFLVSDMGLGFQEADLLGAGKIFTRSAATVAIRAGIHFDRQVFSLGVRQEQLVAAATVIAGCSQEAVQLAAFKLDEHQKSDATDRLYQRLVRVFSSQNVVRDAEIRGASSTSWQVATLVTSDGHKAVYEPVAAHPNSVASALAKFVDLSQLERSPARIAVVRSKEALGTRLSLISTAANVVEETVPDRTLERLALADAA